MELSALEPRLRSYRLVALLSLVFAVTGFSYNAWRLEASEANANRRTASFQVLLELAELEQIVYAAHYDQDPEAGNPRDGWVRVGLVVDLSVLVGPGARERAEALKAVWAERWPRMAEEQAAAEAIVAAVEAARAEVNRTLATLP